MADYRQGEAANGVVLRIWRGKTTIFYECGKLCRASLEKCWNARTFKMVVETISDFEDWPRESEQFFWDLVNFVSERVSHEDREFIEHHIAIAKTTFARRVLHIWHQETLDSRVGLSRQKA